MAPLEIDVGEFGWGLVAIGKRQLKLLELFFPAPPNSLEPLLCGSGLQDSASSLDSSFRKTSRIGPTWPQHPLYGSPHLPVARGCPMNFYATFDFAYCIIGDVTTGPRDAVRLLASIANISSVTMKRISFKESHHPWASLSIAGVHILVDVIAS